MNQTTYTKEEAVASLEKHKGDITLVIKEFLGVLDNDNKREKELNSKLNSKDLKDVLKKFLLRNQGFLDALTDKIQIKKIQNFSVKNKNFKFGYKYKSNIWIFQIFRVKIQLTRKITIFRYEYDIFIT